jgi:hypothetical protein
MMNFIKKKSQAAPAAPPTARPVTVTITALIDDQEKFQAALQRIMRHASAADVYKLADLMDHSIKGPKLISELRKA